MLVVEKGIFSGRFRLPGCGTEYAEYAVDPMEFIEPGKILRWR
jgi:hypothetical protein